jgi:hypothetical protein
MIITFLWYRSQQKSLLTIVNYDRNIFMVQAQVIKMYAWTFKVTLDCYHIFYIKPITVTPMAETSVVVGL